ncbi:agamous-like MADS-box protein AGL93 [Eutrema salsugineum]|uniref:agamous-like MADS-box protein AGL93 n=1 Tax=Eutrema salsugineum TaxID=72664 RepID=UPI000CED10FF|nr:agamous-like MADS-box protein AGL93 [Eutrema salsugineum]
MDSSSSTKSKTKLSERYQTSFKKASFSSTIPASKKNMNISMREQTMLNKAYELSTLCDIQACVIYYGRDGELIKTWPEDQSKVRAMAEKFHKLSHNEKRKKSTNLSQFLNKKLNDEKKRSLDQNDNKFSDKVLAIEHSLETRLRIFQDKLRLLQTKPNQSLAVLSDCGSSSSTVQNHNFMDSSAFFSSDISPNSLLINEPSMMNLSTSLINDQSLAANSYGFTTHLSPSLIEDPHHQQWTQDSLTNNQSKFSIFLYNHDNNSFSQLGDSVSSFDQATAPLSMDLLGPQGFNLRSCSNNNMVIPPQMQN